MKMLKEEHEGNWPGITVRVLIPPALGTRPYHTALTLEEKHGLRSMFGGSAEFAVQCIAVESGLLVTLSKEVQYIVQGLRRVFHPSASPGRVAWMAVVLATQKQDRLIFIPANIGIISLQCCAMQKNAPCLTRAVFKDEV